MVSNVDREIEYIWKRPKSTSSYYFFLNRYGAFISTIAVTVPSFTTLPVRLQGLQHSATNIMDDQSGHHMFPTLIKDLCTLWSFTTYTDLHLGRRGDSNHGVFCVSGVWWSLFIYDALLFALTVSKTWTTRKSYTSRIPFGRILLRDGSVYFGHNLLQCHRLVKFRKYTNILFMWGTDVSTMTTVKLTKILLKPFLRGGLSTFSADISSTMMTHLMLNLHEAAHTGIHTTLEASRVELDTLWSEALDRRSLASRDLRTNPDEEGPDTWRTGNH
ncbi:hypothetical protein BDZ94DRAFT_1234533 [Collybia nuda]|uniref:DUF6533 domain-containing protein n=1 Tax=Collybia nuda TaxID=64659 RepID=A0A9P6CGT2_9AGAR|nr:hypothetical protein BDZ94DRAFT_1234533 [Collybia nuda]